MRESLLNASNTSNIVSLSACLELAMAEAVASLSAWLNPLTHARSATSTGTTLCTLQRHIGKGNGKGRRDEK